MDFPGDDSRNGFRIQHSLVRQWIHAWRQSTRPFGRISHVFLRDGIPVVAEMQIPLVRLP